MEKTKSENDITKQIPHGSFTISGTAILPMFDQNLSTNTNMATYSADIVQTIFTADGITSLNFFSRQPGINVQICRISLPTRVVKEMAGNILKFLNTDKPQTSLPK